MRGEQGGQAGVVILGGRRCSSSLCYLREPKAGAAFPSFHAVMQRGSLPLCHR